MFYSNTSCFWACNTIICICLCANLNKIRLFHKQPQISKRLRNTSSYWELHSSTISIPSDLHEAEMWVMCISACMCVWIHYWLLIWATSFPRRVQKAERESEMKGNAREKSSRVDGNDWPAGHTTISVRSDSVTRSQSACLCTFSEHKSVQQTARQLDPVLPPCISAAHGQMIGQDNMQDYRTWFIAGNCGRIPVF